MCSLPSYTVAISPWFFRRSGYSLDGPIVDTAKSILNEGQVPFKDVSFIGRRSKVDEEPEPVPTILVITDKCSRAVAKRIHREAVSSYPGISVELITEAALAIRCFPVPRNASIFPKWEKICSAILAACDISEWSLLECWRYGTRENAVENPVTVVVSALKTSQNRFYTSTQKIKGILAYYKEPNVCILFLKNEIKQSVQNSTLVKDACTQRLQPGVSL